MVSELVSAPERRLGYRPALDGVRAAAILAVIGFHATKFVSGGFLGVDIFFVLSGFLITSLLVEEWETRGTISLSHFYLRRALRLLPALVVVALGIGSSFPALMTLAMSGATREDAGLASGLVNTSAQVGGALGLAVLATLSATRSDNLIADGVAKASALTSGYHLAFLVGAALVVAGLVVAITVLKPESQAQPAEEPSREPAYSESA